jgi:hypothetical protein
MTEKLRAVAGGNHHEGEFALDRTGREGGGGDKASPDTGVQVGTVTRLGKADARVAEKHEFLAFMHAHDLSIGQLAHWWECSEADAHRIVSLEHLDRGVTRAHVRQLPVSLQRALVWGDTQRLAAGGSGVLPRTERIVRVARETGDVYRAEGPDLIREIDEAVVELQELRRDELARVIKEQKGGAR